MKKLISIILLSLALCEHIIPNLMMTESEAKNQLLNQLRRLAYQQTYSYPLNYHLHVTNLASTTIVKFDKVLHSQVDNLERTHKFPRETVNKFKAIKYSKNTIGFEEFKYNQQVGTSKVENVFGVATRLDEQYVYFAYVKGYATGKAVVKYNRVSYRSCRRILFWKKCKTRYRNKKRGLNFAEKDIIKKSLITKFYRTLLTILDLDQQKMIDKFKNMARTKRTSYPPYYKKYYVTAKTYLDFQTLTYYNKNSLSNLGRLGFDNNSVQRIQNIFGKPYYATEIYQIRKDTIDELQLIMGVAYSVQGKLYISYVNASSQLKRFENYCNLRYDDGAETCLDDSVCVEECNAYKKLVRDPYHADRDIPGFRNRNYHNDLKQILRAEITNEISNILNEIKF